MKSQLIKKGNKSYSLTGKYQHKSSIKGIISPIIINKQPNRNDKCPCGSNKKYKNCHL